MLQIVPEAEFSDFNVPPHEVWRYLGYLNPTEARQDIQKIFQQVMEMGPTFLEPAACYDILPIKRVTSSLVEIEGGVSFNSQDLALRQRGAKELAVFIATVGPRVEEEAGRLIQSGDSVLGYMLDMFASAAVDILAYKVKELIHDHAQSKGYQAITHGICIGKKCPVYRDCGGSIVHWWSPGYGDWSALENKKLFAVVDGSQVGVSVRESGMMTPRKSYASTVPLGPEGEKPPQKCVEWKREWTQRGVKAR
jgi:cobalamin-dependent methionine synthase I